MLEQRTRTPVIATVILILLGTACSNPWKQLHVSDFEKRLWQEIHFSPSEAKQWREVVRELESPKEQPYLIAEKWHAEGFTWATAKPWLEHGWRNAEAARYWSKHGFGYDLEEVKRWNKLGNAEEAARWRDAGYSVDDAIEWQKATESLSAAESWRDHGFGLAEVRRWSYLGDAEEAATWKNSGFSVTEAQTWYRRDIGIEDAMQTRERLDEICPGGIGSIHDLYQANPYDVEGRCYKYSGRQLQLIDRSRGLYKDFTRSSINPESPLARIDFGKRAAPREFSGIVKGTGALKYTTTAGAQKTVPDLRAIVEFGYASPSDHIEGKKARALWYQ